MLTLKTCFIIIQNGRNPWSQEWGFGRSSSNKDKSQ